MSNELAEQHRQLLHDYNSGRITAFQFSTAAVNLVLEAAAEEMAKGDDGHDWSPEGAAAAIRRMKVDANG